jgi:hypothetical protein
MHGFIRTDTFYISSLSKRNYPKDPGADPLLETDFKRAQRTSSLNMDAYQKQAMIISGNDVSSQTKRACRSAPLLFFLRFEIRESG